MRHHTQFEDRTCYFLLYFTENLLWKYLSNRVLASLFDCQLSSNKKRKSVFSCESTLERRFHGNNKLPIENPEARF